MFNGPGRYLVLLMDNVNAEWIGNYVITIVIFTVILRLITMPFDVMQRRSSMKMSEHQPEIQRIQTRYASNPQVMQKKMQEYKKKHGINELAGCLPLLVTFFVFGIFLSGMNGWGDYKNAQLYLETSRMETVAEKEAYFDDYQFAWVTNVWMPDSGLASVVMKYENFSKIDTKRLSLLMTEQEIEEVKNVTEEQYNTNLKFAMDKYEGTANGWFILPLLSGISMLLIQLISTRLNPAQQQAAGTGKTMTLIMTAIWVWVCISANAAFAIYAIVSNFAGLFVTLFTNRHNLSALLPKKKEA